MNEGRNGEGSRGVAVLRVPPGLIQVQDASGEAVFEGRSTLLARGGDAPATIPCPLDKPVEIVWADGVRLVLRGDDLPRDEARSMRDERVIPGTDGSRGAISEAIVRLVVGVAVPIGLRAAARAWDERQVPDGGGCLSTVDELGRLTPIRPDRPLLRDVGRVLVLIHGTFVTTASSFRSLFESPIWRSVHANFDCVVAFDHPTLTRDPVENAQALVGALAALLPEGGSAVPVDLTLLSHSRGGLVADVLAAACAQQPAGATRDLASSSRFEGTDEAWLQRLSRGFGELRTACKKGKLRVGQVVRVAAPVRGTTLAGARLDLWLNALLHAVDLVPGLVTAGLVDGVRSVLLALVQERANPDATPGITAMVATKPFVPWLNALTADSEIVCITGDAADRSAFYNRLRTFFAEKFFGSANDLVVDTPLMEGGAHRQAGDVSVRPFRNGPGATVDHFSYFNNTLVLAEIARDLLQPSVRSIPGVVQPTEAFQGGTRDLGGLLLDLGDGDGIESVNVEGARATIVLVPGIMGTTLQARGGDTVWPRLLALAGGGFVKNLAIKNAGVEVGNPLAGPYRRLIDFLMREKVSVEMCGFDWRSSIEKAAERLDRTMQSALGPEGAARPPTHLLAHSLGGLVARAWLGTGSASVARWKQQGGRLLMAGTPNHGSYAIPMIALGHEPMIGGLAAIDLLHDRRTIVETASRFPGILEMMPVEPGSAPESWSLFDPETWRNHDARLDGEDLARAKNVRISLASVVDPDRMVYVAGTADETPCAMPLPGRREVAVTDQGDGRVTWWHGRLEGVPMWRMDASHGDLCDTPRAFPALLELLLTGQTEALPRLPRILERPSVERGLGSAVSPLKISPLPTPPPNYPGVPEIVRAAVGGQATVPTGQAPMTLKVDAILSDFQPELTPLVLTHTTGSRMSLMELIVDHVLGGELRRRARLRRYPNQFGEVVSVGGASQGKVFIVGLGPVERLTRPRRTEAMTRAFLEVLHDAACGDWNGARAILHVPIASGDDDTDQELEDRVVSALDAVLEANRIVRESARDDMTAPQGEGDGSGGDARAVLCGGLRFLHPHVACAERILGFARDWVNGPGRVANDQAGVAIATLPLVFDKALECMPGIAFSAMEACDREADSAPAVSQRRANEVVRRISVRAPELDGRQDPVAPRVERLEFDTGGSRATFRRHPQLVSWSRINELSQTLTTEARIVPSRISALRDHVVPADFVDEFDAGLDLQIGVDERSASIPWEAFVAPSIQGTNRIGSGISVLRQFEDRTPPSAALAVENAQALVICCPGGDDGVPFLGGATQEANAVVSLLRGRYYVRQAGPDWVDIATALAQPAEIIHLIGHGVFRPGDPSNTGLVARGGIVSVNDMRGFERQPPSLVFLNACHLARTDASYHELAAGMAVQLVERDVPAVIAAGWAVNDAAAVEFATCFYRFALADKSFMRAVAAARASAYRAASNHATWAAYQCYGDPSFHLPSVQPQYSSLSERLVADLTRPVGTMSEAEDALACVLRFRALPVATKEPFGLNARWVFKHQFEDLLRRIETSHLPVDPRLLARAKRLLDGIDGGELKRPATSEMRETSAELEVLRSTEAELRPPGDRTSFITSPTVPVEATPYGDRGSGEEAFRKLQEKLPPLDFDYARRYLDKEVVKGADEDLAQYIVADGLSQDLKNKREVWATRVARKWQAVVSRTSKSAVQRWLWTVLRHLRGAPPRDQDDATVAALLRAFQTTIPEVLDDPNAGTCLGRSFVQNEVELTATVREGTGGRFAIEAIVTFAKDVEGSTVEFVLHPTFRRSRAMRPVEKNAARLQFDAWDSFTIVARTFQTSGKLVALELDLGSVADAQKPEFTRFRLG